MAAGGPRGEAQPAPAAWGRRGARRRRQRGWLQGGRVPEITSVLLEGREGGMAGLGSVSLPCSRWAGGEATGTVASAALCPWHALSQH